jgi:hypothetical protein
VSPVIASTTTESQPIEITQLFSGQTLSDLGLKDYGISHYDPNPDIA